MHWMDVTKIVSEETHIPLKELMGRARYRHIVGARQLAMWAVREYSRDYAGRPFSYPWIGSKFHRDHATTLHSVRKAGSDPSMKDMRERIRKRLEQVCSVGDGKCRMQRT